MDSEHVTLLEHLMTQCHVSVSSQFQSTRRLGSCPCSQMATVIETGLPFWQSLFGRALPALPFLLLAFLLFDTIPAPH